MLMLRRWAVLLILVSAPRHLPAAVPKVEILRTPEAGIQPQAVMDRSGVLHLLYYRGSADGGDLFYRRLQPGSADFGPSLRINHQAGSAIAIGSIRRGQLALGKNGRAHVAWLGSKNAVRSSASLTEGDGAVVAAWENEDQVQFSLFTLPSLAESPVFAPPGKGKRKHPSVARNACGALLLAWTEDTGWEKGGALAWQLFNAEGKPLGAAGRRAGVPVWSLVAAVARPNGNFVIIY